MKGKLSRTVSLILSAAMLSLTFSTISLADTTKTSNQTNSNIKGMFVLTKDNADFPSKPNLSANGLQNEVQTIVEYAKNNNYNSIFFEVSPSGDALYNSQYLPTSHYLASNQGGFTFFDPLNSMVSYAKNKGISVYAIVNPYYVSNGNVTLDSKNLAATNPESLVYDGSTMYFSPSNAMVQAQIQNTVNEITSKYDVAGVLLSGTNKYILSTPGFADAYKATVTNCYNAVKRNNQNKTFGIISESFDNNDFLNSTVKLLVDGKALDYIVPNSNITADQYSSFIYKLKKVTDNSSTKIISSYNIEDNSNNKIENKMFVDMSSNINSQISTNYSKLSQNKKLAENYYINFTNPISPNSIQSLNVPTTFQITRPSGNITTSYASYFITGTSNPALPVAFNGKQIERQTSNGSFGVFVTLNVGVNVFSFTQGGATKTIQITRTTGSSVSPISKIVPSSAYPKVNDAVFEGEQTQLSCTAPYGGTVTANVAGTSVQLNPSSAVGTGMPVTYNAAVQIPNVAGNITKNIGAVVYTLTYNGVTTTQNSAGQLYFVPSGSALAIETNSTVTSVYENPANLGVFLTTLKQGIRDTAVSKNDNYFVLQSGGYVNKVNVNILTDQNNVQNKLEKIDFAKGGREETFTFNGFKTAPYHTSINGKTLTVSFYNCSVPSDIGKFQSSIFSSVSQTASGNNVQYTFTVSDNAVLWGYDVEYNANGSLMLYAKQKPAISNTFGKPLENITVVLDAGHGGKDSGALGIAGATGPMEKNINLADALATKQRLEQLGAKVYMTRQDDAFPSLDDRKDFSEKYKPDFFISIHHNSVSESTNSIKSYGIETYYHENYQSAAFSKNLLDSLSADLNRKSRGSLQGYFYVTRMTYTPSVLIELGYLPNPSEYEDVTNRTKIFKTSLSITDAIIKTINS